MEITEGLNKYKRYKKLAENDRIVVIAIDKTQLESNKKVERLWVTINKLYRILAREVFNWKEYQVNDTQTAYAPNEESLKEIKDNDSLNKLIEKEVLKRYV